jgi:hypothetical protein
MAWDCIIKPPSVRGEGVTGALVCQLCFAAHTIWRSHAKANVLKTPRNFEENGEDLRSERMRRVLWIEMTIDVAWRGTSESEIDFTVVHA